MGVLQLQGSFETSLLNLFEGFGRGERTGAVAEFDYLDIVADMDLRPLSTTPKMPSCGKMQSPADSR